MWEIVFLMLVLKIPIVYLCLVVWWAVRAEPRPLEGATKPAVLDPEPEPPRRWLPPLRRPRPGPHAGPVRRYERRARPAPATGARR